MDWAWSRDKTSQEEESRRAEERANGGSLMFRQSLTRQPDFVMDGDLVHPLSTLKFCT